MPLSLARLQAVPSCSKREEYPLGGDPIRTRFANTCNFQNLWHNACINLRISSEEKQHIESAYENIANKSGNGVRICIARHHFTQEMIEFNEANNARWVIPLSPTQVEEGKLLPDEYKTDGVFRYNPNLGDGRPDRWKRENPVMYIKSPCTSRHEVKSIVDDIQIDNRRHRKQLAADAAPPPPPPSDWHHRMEVLKRDNKAKDKRIKELEKEVKKLRLIKNRKVDIKQKQKKRLTNAVEKTSGELALYESNSILWDKIVKLLSSAGGLSRLTIFWDGWHDEHDEAAHVLFGYRNWKETKQYLRDYFPDELGPDSAWPSPIVANLIDSDLKNVPLTQVEKCLLCRMFFHLRDRQKFLALIIDRHRTTVGNVIKEWAPLWGEVGEDLSILNVTEDYLIKEV